ncbi:phosphotransferase family protein [Sphingobium phenoxybenzoativorans]|uniref:Phosphotransferase family protein n=1 Tax=Sphingobium phenoxybenzoativorans TaxID=1592790 RepID=A0A975K8F1_9SPHN|nr:phosphotransferase family protein [Sphingobium phenoxybenzoativorans]QUT06721.1 phosphotransferase family protein [Sphingobium phenoxybenzoativorans]
MPFDPAVEELLRSDRLVPWLDSNAPALGSGPLQARFLHGGTSNTIIALERNGRRAVLRRPPLNPPPNSEKAMMREAQALKALGGTGVPHPELFGFSEDPSIIGAPFYIMEHVDGWAAELGEGDCLYPPPFDRADQKRPLAFALIDALVALQAVDYRAAGLGDFGHPDGFLDRQVSRWRKQFEGYEARYPGYRRRDIPGFDTVAAWLGQDIPAMGAPGIVHGDFGPPNVLFANDPPVRVAALIDWELATIGDPMMDVALLAINLRDDARPDVIPRAAYFDSTHYPTRGEVIDYYGRKSGRDVSRADYYLTLAQFRLACILEYKVAASMTGALPKAAGDRFAPMVVNLIADAHDRIARSEK